MARQNHERSPLLSRQSYASHNNDDDDVQIVGFDKEDTDNPRSWPRRKKMINVAIIALMALMSPFASSMFTPGINDIADDFKVPKTAVVTATTGYVVMLGIGPLILAPLSEMFGRRKLYIINYAVFSLLQIPIALSVNIGMMTSIRTIAGFAGSVGIANGGGTINDMFEPSQRAAIFGWYLLGPLLGPTLGPIIGGLVVDKLGWRWVFGILAVICSALTFVGYLFLYESYAPTILQNRCKQMRKDNPDTQYKIEDADERPLGARLKTNIERPLKILFTQPVVFTMAIYQAVVFGIMFAIYTNMQDIYGGEYDLTTTQVGLTYIGIGGGFLFSVWFLVPLIDKIYNKLTEKNNGESKPEFRLPLGNVGSVLIPASLFVFGWAIEKHMSIAVSIGATVFFGIGQVAIFNTVQNYYIDAFEKTAASAIAAGAAFRSIVGGMVPLIVPKMFDKIGYGWGWSVFGFMALALAPAPLLFYNFGERIRKSTKTKI